MKIDEARLRELIPDAERLLFGDAIPAEYRSDALGRLKGTADALIFPLSTEEVSGVLRYAHENRVPVTPRGAVRLPERDRSRGLSDKEGAALPRGV